MYINQLEYSLKKISNYQWVFQCYLYFHIEIQYKDIKVYLEPLKN